MKLILLITALSLHISSETAPINWNDLIGKWECVKVIHVVGKDSTDVSSQYNPHFTEFTTNSKFRDDYLAGNTSIEGIYSIDKSTNTINFTQAVQCTKYPDAKVPMPDTVFKTGKQELVRGIDSGFLIPDFEFLIPDS